MAAHPRRLCSAFRNTCEFRKKSFTNRGQSGNLRPGKKRAYAAFGMGVYRHSAGIEKELCTMPRRMPTAAIYTALNSLSEGFEQALSAMDLLNKTGLGKSDLFEGCRILTQEAAAWARYQVVQT